MSQLVHMAIWPTTKVRFVKILRKIKYKKVTESPNGKQCDPNCNSDGWKVDLWPFCVCYIDAACCMLVSKLQCLCKKEPKTNKKSNVNFTQNTLSIAHIATGNANKRKDYVTGRPSPTLVLEIYCPAGLKRFPALTQLNKLMKLSLRHAIKFGKGLVTSRSFDECQWRRSWEQSYFTTPPPKKTPN